MHLLLIRHGQSQNNILEAAHGAGKAYDEGRVVDPPLSQLGERQAGLLGRHLGRQLLRSKQHVRLLCSSMTRALQTMQPLARVLGLPVWVHPELHEVKGFKDTSGRGEDSGPSGSEIGQRFPGYDASLIPEGGQGSETCAEAYARAKCVVALLHSWAASEGASDNVVVIVSHNDFIGLLARLLLVPSGAACGAATDNPYEIFKESYWPMNNTGISHFIVGVRPPGDAYKVDTYLLYWNRSDHLCEAVRSGVQWKNVGFAGAAQWARVGDGGSGLRPKFEESAVVYPVRPWYDKPAWAAAMVALTAAAALVLLRRS